MRFEWTCSILNCYWPVNNCIAYSGCTAATSRKKCCANCKPGYYLSDCYCHACEDLANHCISYTDECLSPTSSQKCCTSCAPGFNLYNCSCTDYLTIFPTTSPTRSPSNNPTSPQGRKSAPFLEGTHLNLILCILILVLLVILLYCFFNSRHKNKPAIFPYDTKFVGGRGTLGTRGEYSEDFRGSPVSPVPNAVELQPGTILEGERPDGISKPVGEI